MTTNARDEKWSEWFTWHGAKKCPIDSECTVEFVTKGMGGGETSNPKGLMWVQAGTEADIIAYRYKIKEPESVEVTEAEEEAWQAKERELNGKQLRYQDAKGEDWIDEFARTSTVDEFRGAMRFTLGKYNRRAGKKDELIKEIEKMRDYCDRWIAYERAL